MAQYDMIVIGGGAAGIAAARLAVALGQKVALIEKAKIGGECVWSGCIASKTLLKVARVAYHAKEFQKFGLLSVNQVAFDASLVMDHVRACIDRVYEAENEAVLTSQGIELFFGSPEFINSISIKLNGAVIEAKKFIIATGSSAAIPSIDGLKRIKYLTNDTFFSLKTLPKSIIILGAGPIGIELGSALVRLGVDTHIIEYAQDILPREDKELSRMLRSQLEKEGLQIHTGLKVIKVVEVGDKIAVHAIDMHENPFIFHAEKLLLASGRVANVGGLGLEKAGVMYSSSGIAVDSTLRTTAKNIYACGDVVGPYRFSHVATYQAIIAARNAIFPFWKKKIDYSQMIWVTFCDPEFAVAGLSEEEARKIHDNKIQVIKVPYSALDRARTDMDEFGMAKFILDKRGRILGVSILGNRAGEIIHEAQIGKYYGIKLKKFYAILHAYPTYSEIILKAAEEKYLATLQNNIFLKVARYVLGYRRRKKK